jgi:ubiquinol-cytochrome c reductase iron-sulfur subunit
VRVLRLLWLAVLFVVGLARRPWRRPRIIPEGDPSPTAELVVSALLLGAAACGVVFVVAYAMEWSNLTQWLGLSLGGALALIAAALVTSSRTLVVTEHVEEQYPDPVEPGNREEEERIAQIVEESGSRITRKRLLVAAGSAAGAALGAALLAPLASFGPWLDTESLYDSPWRRGLRLVDDGGHPYRAEDIEEETFYTAFPEGVSHEELGSPLVVVRLTPSSVRLPRGRRRWAPEGILAYSKICTHAGCAIALYRKPTFPPAQPAPALVCPCHYSTFNPATGGTVEYGPAGRPLPQLPLFIDSRRYVRAAGNFSGPVGPSFWGVRTRRPRTAS